MIDDVVDVALQQWRGRIPVLIGLAPAAPSRHVFMVSIAPRQVLIVGITRSGRTFRPSDWAERLAGAMSSFRPGGASQGMGAYIGYSPLCVPRTVEGAKGVLVSPELRDIEPMAWDFVMNFARDNELQVREFVDDLSGGTPRPADTSGLPASQANPDPD